MPPPPAAPSGDPAIIVMVCPACGEARAEGARYCEECGHDYGGKTAAEAEDRNFLRGPVLWVFMLFWALLAVGGLWYLFTLLWAA